MRRSFLNEETWEDICQALQGCKPGRETSILIKEFAEKFGLSKGHIYRKCQDWRFSFRKQRKDKGKPRKPFNVSQKSILFKLCKEGFSAPKAIEIAEVNGIIEKGYISAGQLNRLLREESSIRKKLEVYSPIYLKKQAEYPNQIHQFSCSIRNVLQVDSNGRIIFKPRGRGAKLMLYLLLDDYSRVLFARYYLTQDVFNALEFLQCAWSRKENQFLFPFFGLPKILYCTNTLFNKSQKFNKILSKLRISLITNRKDFPVSSHKLSRVFYTINQNFEIISKLKPFRNLETINISLYDWLIGYNNKIHSSILKSPFKIWMQIKNEQLIDVPNISFNRINY